MSLVEAVIFGGLMLSQAVQLVLLWHIAKEINMAHIVVRAERTHHDK